jgi:hypothetical protein
MISSHRLLHFCLATLLLMISRTGFSQVAGANLESSQTELSFFSERLWKLSRFYAIGKWDEKNKYIVWAGSGAASPLTFVEENCRNANSLKISSFSFNPQVEAEVSGLKENGAKESREILESGDWLAVEVLADLLEDKIYLQLQTSVGMCEARADLIYSWAPGKRGIRPLLMLGPTRNLHGNLVVNFEVPERNVGRSGIVLDLLLGYWKAHYPNGGAGAQSTILYVPATIARGEWYMPFHERVGLSLGLEQAPVALGSARDQSVLLSDYNVGVFYDFLLYKGDAWVSRLALNYRGHLADDSLAVPSLNPANRNSSYLAVRAGTHFYFSRIYMVGGEYSYSSPSRLAGNGIDQSFSEWLFRVGVRGNSSVQLIGEIGMRSYGLKGFSADNLLTLNLGVRLKL